MRLDISRRKGCLSMEDDLEGNLENMEEKDEKDMDVILRIIISIIVCFLC